MEHSSCYSKSTERPAISVTTFCYSTHQLSYSSMSLRTTLSSSPCFYRKLLDLTFLHLNLASLCLDVGNDDLDAINICSGLKTHEQ